MRWIIDLRNYVFKFENISSFDHPIHRPNWAFGPCPRGPLFEIEKSFTERWNGKEHEK